jgi:hypothetical protein
VIDQRQRRRRRRRSTSSISRLGTQAGRGFAAAGLFSRF